MVNVTGVLLGFWETSDVRQLNYSCSRPNGRRAGLHVTGGMTLPSSQEEGGLGRWEHGGD